MDYSLDALEKRFTEHAEKLQKQHEEQERQRIENGWDEPGYDYTFNLPKAFITIVQEIKKLKEGK